MRKKYDNSKGDHITAWKDKSLENFIGEEWALIDGYEKEYMVSNFGRVKSVWHIVKYVNCKKKKEVKEKIISQSLYPNGYCMVNLWKSNKGKCAIVHRLVGNAFIPNPEIKACINHKNGIRVDNKIDNLEWNTISENNHHSFDVLGRKSYKSKKVYCPTLSMAFDSINKASEILGVGYREVKEICEGKREEKYGLIFNYS